MTTEQIDQTRDAAMKYADANMSFNAGTVPLCKAFAAGAAWMQEQDQWIPVSERLPATPFPAVLGTDGKNQFIVNYTAGKQIEVDIDDGDAEDFGCEEVNEQFYIKAGWYELTEQRGGYYDEIWIDRNITHWQPLPKPPKP